MWQNLNLTANFTVLPSCIDKLKVFEIVLVLAKWVFHLIKTHQGTLSPLLIKINIYKSISTKGPVKIYRHVGPVQITVGQILF